MSALHLNLGAPLALSVSTSLVLIRLFWLGVSGLQTSLVLPLACLLALKLSNCLVLNQVLWIRGVCTADQPWCSPLACFFSFSMSALVNFLLLRTLTNALVNGQK